MQQGKEEQALSILAKFHGGGDPNNALVQLEMEEMRSAVALDAANNTEAWWDYRPLFATKSNAWRMVNPIMMAIFGQASCCQKQARTDAGGVERGCKRCRS